MTKQETQAAIPRIWESATVREASERCDAITEECSIAAQAAADGTEDGESEAAEWRSLARQAIERYNAHCPVFSD